MKALDILKNLKNEMQNNNGIINWDCSYEYFKKVGNAIKELEELKTKDRLAELEKVILDYYLAKGYQVGIGGWGFKVNISTYHKDKEIQIMFRKDRGFNYETVFRRWKATTKEMFDEAFEHFSIKE